MGANIILFFFCFSDLLDVDIDDIIKSFSQFPSQLDLAGYVFLEEVLIVAVGQLSKNGTWAGLHQIILNHEALDVVSLKFQKVVYLQVSEKGSIYLAVVVMLCLLAVLGKIISGFISIEEGFNIEALRSFEFAGKVEVVGLGVCKHPQVRFGGDFYNKSQVIGLGVLFLIDRSVGHWQRVKEELVLEGKRGTHVKNYRRSSPYPRSNFCSYQILYIRRIGDLFSFVFC